ncbi:hypothetical protein [Breznakiella homolactica]|uniref:Uncharacterized protein n=1 Tax=Breznakiella homolactica TaxID=2798577 RepID=A0A7T8BAK1_9SPIR|nr:hypothetical protein [Breznakiella homolactica]QQO09587.1 hypothetical protein JFL75_01320 [Breznakiella homolactica]
MWIFVVFVFMLFIVGIVLGIRWAARSWKKSNEKGKQTIKQASDMMYGEEVELTPSTVATMQIIRQVAKTRPTTIEQLLEWTETVPYPAKSYVLKLIHVSVK